MVPMEKSGTLHPAERIRFVPTKDLRRHQAEAMPVDENLWFRKWGLLGAKGETRLLRVGLVSWIITHRFMPRVYFGFVSACLEETEETPSMRDVE